MAAQHSPADFRYNGRAAAALLPSLAVLAGFGGKVPVGVALVGAMLCYILDASRVREGALAAAWLTLGGANLAMWASGAVFSAGRPLPLALLIAACVSATLLSTGVWATLQFKWVQLRYPVAVSALEKLLLATAFSTAAAVHSWGLTAAVGAAAAPFYLAPLLCLLYHALGRPLHTSFHVRGVKGSAIGGKRAQELQVQARAEGAAAACLLFCLPAGLYAAVHRASLGAWQHCWALLLLLCGPLLYLSCLEDGLWWLTGSAQRQLAARRLLCLGALAGGLAGLEGRLILPAFGQYISLPPPWNYAAVALALYGCAALAALRLSGLLSAEQGSLLTASALLASAGLGGVAAGMPLLALGAPLLAAGGLAFYLESRLLRDYALFAAGAAASAAWFLHHHFWFLDISLRGLSVRALCGLIWVAALPPLLLPALVVAAKAPRALLSALLCLEVMLLMALEEHLYLGGGSEVEGEMYPAVMVAVTSALGAAVTRQLRARRAIGRAGAWLLHCALGCKLSMLLLPQGRLPLPLLALALAATAPVLLPPKPGALRPALGWAAAAAVAAAALASRHALRDALLLLSGGPPSQATLLGGLALVAVGGCAPLLLSQPGWARAHRAALQAGAAGALLLLLQPPLPAEGGCLRWLCLPSGEPLEDTALWAEAGADGGGAALWLLLAAGLAAALAAGAGAESAALGPACAAGAGAAAGAYLALAFFPGQPSLQATVGAATVAAACLLVALRLGSAASPPLLALLLGAWAACLLAGCGLQAALPLPPLPPRAARFFPDAAALVERDRFWATRAALAAVAAAEALLLAFAMKLRISAGAAGAAPAAPPTGGSAAAALRLGNAVAGRAAGFLGQCLPDVPGLPPTASSQRRRQGLLQDGLPAWLPTASNVVATSCFLLGCELNLHFAQGSALGILLLAPVLLLLSHDAWLLGSLGSRRRYSPPVAAASLLVAATAVVDAVAARNNAGGSAWHSLRHLWLVAACLPAHACLNQYLWTHQQRPGRHLLGAGAAAATAAALAQLSSVRVLAGAGVAMCCVQLAAMKQVQRDGMRLI